MRTLSIFAVAVALVLGAAWSSWALTEDSLTEAEAKQLYLEAYTQKGLAPDIAMEKLERVVAGVPEDFEYQQKAARLLSQLRGGAVSDPPSVDRPAPSKATAFPLPEPPGKPYDGPPLTAREAQAQGVQHLQKGQMELAISLLWHALELDPEGQSRAHKMIGICYARIGEKCQAARHYQAYVDSHPGAADAAKVQQILRKYMEDGEGSAACLQP